MTDPDQPEQPGSRVVDDTALMNVYLSGMASGIASQLINISMPHPVAESVAKRITYDVVADPAAYEEIRARVVQLVDEPDNPPTTAIVTSHVERRQ